MEQETVESLMDKIEDAKLIARDAIKETGPLDIVVRDKLQMILFVLGGKNES